MSRKIKNISMIKYNIANDLIELFFRIDFCSKNNISILYNDNLADIEHVINDIYKKLIYKKYNITDYITKRQYLFLKDFLINKRKWKFDEYLGYNDNIHYRTNTLINNIDHYPTDLEEDTIDNWIENCLKWRYDYNNLILLMSDKLKIKYDYLINANKFDLI